MHPLLIVGGLLIGYELLTGKQSSSALPPSPGLPGTPPSAGPPTSDVASLAAQVDSDVRAKGMSYDRQLVITFQNAAKLWADGMYGPATAGAVQYYVNHDPPAPLYSDAKNYRGITPYTPPA